MFLQLPWSKCCSTFPSLWIRAVWLQTYFPQVTHTHWIFLLPSVEGRQGEEYESREQTQSSSNCSFPLKRIPRELQKAHHDSSTGWASSTAGVCPSPLSKALRCPGMKEQWGAWSRSWRHTEGQLQWAGLFLWAAMLSVINWHRDFLKFYMTHTLTSTTAREALWHQQPTDLNRIRDLQPSFEFGCR